MKKLVVIMQIVTIFILSFFINLIGVYADEINVTRFIPDNINYTINDGKLEVICSINDEGSYEIHGDMNTKGLEEGYYTSYIYEDKNLNWSNYEGVSFHMENMGEGPIDMNLSVLSKDGIRFNVSNENVILIKRENNSIIERAHLPYGAVNINKGFIGTIYIPFESFISDESDKKSINNRLSQIYSWGISITCRQGETKHFKISDFALINSNQDLNDYLKINYKITGEDNIIIPESGDYIYQYGVNDSLSKSETIFSVSDGIEGVSINKDGLLTVGDNAEPQIITIKALKDMDNTRTVYETKSVNLLRAWSHDRTYEDGVSMAIPNERNYSMSLNENNIFIDKILTIIVRVTSLIIFGLSFWVYYTWLKMR